tara:strand:+ start:77 stop:682 length:606 start_codon:yes stop_codon:yes gene_type:complete
MEPTRRFVDADNSCLFASIGYNLDHRNFSDITGLQYRQLLAQYLENNDVDKNMFEVPKEEYIEMIQNPGTWGGAVELRLFSDMFQMEIASIDVQSNRVDIFGEDKKYPQRIYVLYNGVHYDPLVMAVNESSLDDISIFESDDHETLIQMQNYCKSFKDKGDYVDISKMNKLKCSICGEMFETQDEALIHAENFKHWNFEQI